MTNVEHCIKEVRKCSGGLYTWAVFQRKSEGQLAGHVVRGVLVAQAEAELDRRTVKKIRN